VANQPWHNTPHYKKMAPLIRAAAYNNPNHRCPHCQLTLQEMRRTRPDNIAGWDCGHIVDRDETYGFQAECSYCNRSRGSTKRNQTTRKPVTSQNWAAPQNHRG